MPPKFDLSGQRFGRIVVGTLSEVIDGQRWWECQCDCGKFKAVRQSSLRSGNTRSCGCLHSDKLSARRKTHGMKRTPEYKIWDGMKQRCLNADHKSFARYGGRGIAICDRWLNSFEAFFADMGPRPFPRAQLDREDNDGNYEPGNCKWSTPRSNANNRSSSRIIELNGERKTLAQWAADRGMSQNALHARLARGWSAARAIETPLRGSADGK